VRWLRALYNLSPMVREVVFPEKKNADAGARTDLLEDFEYLTTAREVAARGAGRSPRDRKYLDTCVLYLNRHLRSLLHRNDRLGMSASLESRFPFLDEELVKFAINLPVKFKGRYGPRVIDRKHPFLTDKWVVRELGARKLPRGIFQRSKLGFPVDHYQTMRVSPEFFRGSYLQELLQLADGKLATLAGYESSYFTARLAAINIFGEMFGRGRTVDEVTDHVQRHVTLVG
jgi:asparagine synthase (glutamine-hydrolysing)